MGNTATFADNPAQENRTGKAAIVADDDGEETEEAAQGEAPKAAEVKAAEVAADAKK